MKFIAGPAAATSIIPRRGLANRQAETGTGLAQPNITTTRPSVINCEISKNPGRRMVPNLSICASGLSDNRPARLAVSSPNAQAA